MFGRHKCFSQLADGGVGGLVKALQQSKEPPIRVRVSSFNVLAQVYRLCLAVVILFFMRGTFYSQEK